MRAIVRLEQMILAMKERGTLRSAAVEEAFRRNPRHLFLKGEAVDAAYVDAPIPIEERGGVVHSSISAPSTVAAMLEQLRVRTGKRILEIGAGTGYNAALMAHLAGSKGRVTTIEIDAQLSRLAGENLKSLGIEHVQVVSGDGALGFAAGAPYDRIILTVGTADIAAAWIDQLEVGGVLLIPLWVRGEQLTVAFKKTPSGLVSESIRQHGFVRLRGQGAGRERMVVSRSYPELAYSVEGRGPARGKMIDSQIAELTSRWGTGVATDAQRARAGLIPWLAIHDARHCLLDWRGTGAPPIPMLYGERYGSMTSAFVDRNAVAVIGILDPADGGEVLMAASTTSRALAADLHEAVKQWDAVGQPNLDRLKLSIYDNAHPVQPGQTTIQLRSGMALGARWAAHRH